MDDFLKKTPLCIERYGRVFFGEKPAAKILVFKTYSAFANPFLVYGAIDGSVTANQKVLWELAGRNIAMMVVTLLALRSQNAMFLAFTMIINLVREGFDMFMGIRFAGGDMGQIMQAGSFLIFWCRIFSRFGN